MRSIQNPYANLVVGAKTRVPLGNGNTVPSINFDNAATTPPFYSVLKEVNRFSQWYSSIHRGAGYKSKYSSDVYEEARTLVQDFVHSDPSHDVVIFTKNTTESVNLLSYVLSQQKKTKPVVLSTWMEHSSNDLPWKEHFTVDYVEIDSKGRLSIDDLEQKLIQHKGSVALVSVTGAANVTGYLNPIHEIATMAHEYGAQIMVDGAQLVPHAPVDMKPISSNEHIDYLVFSAHKMYAPFGTGVLIGPKETFADTLPLLLGGSTFRLYTHQQIQWNPPPQKDEAGTPNLMGVVALSAAIRTLRSLNMHDVFQHEVFLYDYAVQGMQKIPDIQFYCDPSNHDTISIIPFNLQGIPHQLMANILANEAGISVRNGFFCAHPYCERLLSLSPSDMEYYFEHPNAPLPGMVRVSFGLYNTIHEINQFLRTLEKVSNNKSYYFKKYAKLYDENRKFRAKDDYVTQDFD
jgi:selenocysteine lyase/cysteine desulfurase